MEYDNEKDAEDALEALQKKDFQGSEINIGKFSFHLTLKRVEQEEQQVRLIKSKFAPSKQEGFREVPQL